MKAPIPEAVSRFLLAYVPSVPHLEALLLIRRSVDRAWSADRIAASLYIDADAATHCLDDLVRHGLLVADDAPRRYRVRNTSPELSSLLEELDRGYARRVRDVAELIHSAGAQNRPGCAASGAE
jgi:hypothetical protein